MTNPKLIKATGTIRVNKEAATVFEFFANPGNDHLWRTEINQSFLQGDLQLGAAIAEYAHLSKKVSNNLTELNCIQFDKNKLAVFETPANAQFYQRSQREVKAISANTTEIIYTLDFDLGIVKYALGFALPKFIVAYKASSDLRKYLRQLKTKLETS